MRRTTGAAVPAWSVANLAVLATTLISSAVAAQSPAQPSSTPWFLEIAAASGLDFVHFNGMSGERYYLEVMGPGGALLDYDQDGDLDLYLTQGHMLGAGKTIADATLPPRGPLRHRLYRNDLHAGARTAADAPLPRRHRGERHRRARLRHGGGGGRLRQRRLRRSLRLQLRTQPALAQQRRRDVQRRTRESGTAEDRWSVSASFVDFDADGWLDLFVVNYLDYAPERDKLCLSERGEPDYCLPSTIRRCRRDSFATAATAPSRTSRRSSASAPRRATASAWSRATSTRTAASTSSSPTTPCPTTSG